MLSFSMPKLSMKTNINSLKKSKISSFFNRNFRSTFHPMPKSCSLVLEEILREDCRT